MNILSRLKGYFLLGKPRISSLLIFSGVATYVYASDKIYLQNFILFTVLGTMMVFAANTFNSYLDIESDRLMYRTKYRPLPSGMVSKPEALSYGFILISISSLGLMYVFGVEAMAAALFGALYYIFIYTLLLKNRTIYNTVVGGVAGFMPTITGWLAAGNPINITVILISLLVFFWSPAHFWSLAYAIKDEYKASRFLMLPAVKPEDVIKKHIIGFNIVTEAIYIILLLILDGLVVKIGIVIGLLLIAKSINLIYMRLDRGNAWRSFKLSTTSLFIFYIALFIDGIL